MNTSFTTYYGNALQGMNIKWSHTAATATSVVSATSEMIIEWDILMFGVSAGGADTQTI